MDCESRAKVDLEEKIAEEEVTGGVKTGDLKRFTGMALSVAGAVEEDMKIEKSVAITALNVSDTEEDERMDEERWERRFYIVSETEDEEIKDEKSDARKVYRVSETEDEEMEDEKRATRINHVTHVYLEREEKVAFKCESTSRRMLVDGKEMETTEKDTTVCWKESGLIMVSQETLEDEARSTLGFQSTSMVELKNEDREERDDDIGDYSQDAAIVPTVADKVFWDNDGVIPAAPEFLEDMARSHLLSGRKATANRDTETIVFLQDNKRSEKMVNIVSLHDGGLSPETEETHQAKFTFICHSISTDDGEDSDTEGSDCIHVTQETLEEGEGRPLDLESIYQDGQEKRDREYPEGILRARRQSSQDSGLIAVRQETLVEQEEGYSSGGETTSTEEEAEADVRVDQELVIPVSQETLGEETGSTSGFESASAGEVEDKSTMDRDNKDGKGDAEVNTAFKIVESQRLSDILWIVQQGAGAGQERRQPDPLGEEGGAEEEEGAGRQGICCCSWAPWRR